MKTRKILMIVFLVLSFPALAQITNIPDPDFEQALIDLGIDSDGIINGQVLTADIENVQILDVNTRQIHDLTGIEGFVALEELDISINPMFYNLDLSNSPQLVKLDFRGTDIITLNISNNPLLEYLISDFSLLTELDVSNNVLLKELQVGTPDGLGNIASPNDIQTLDLSNNPLLERLWLIDMAALFYINLKSGGNETLADVFISCEIEGFPCGQNLCVEVDDFEAAQSNQPPYNSWLHPGIYSEDCSMSIPSLEKEFAMVYPIPAEEEIFIHHQNEGEIKVSLYNLTGQLLLQEVFNHNNNQLSLKALPSGTYFLMIETQEGQKEVKKIVKN